VKSLNLNIQAW